MKSPLLRIAGLFAAFAFATAAWALDAFVIKEIKAEGLKRLDIGTVLSYLPLSVGDRLDDQTSGQAIRALYASGLFADVELEHGDGDVLIVKVQERPAISSFAIEGNQKIGGDQLKDSLKKIGLSEGEPFKRALLDGVEQELRRQYYANGYYDVAIDTEVKDEPNNHVSLKIKVTEGKVTRIRQINIIGNKAFKTDDLKDQLKLEQTLWWFPFQSSDRYSKQQLLGDLETLTSYYQDRGYLKFNISSVQVELSPDKEAIYITLNVEEGDVYKIKGHRFSGETILSTAFLEKLVTTPDGAVFSRKEATESSNRIEGVLADTGYAFAQVSPLPEVDEDKKEVSINYYVQPGKRAYVRHITFSGNASTNDETLRREMRQLEAAPFSKGWVERSRTRLARLPFVEEAEVETKPVPGSEDLVDVNFNIKERPPGSIQFGVGYSGAGGFLITGNITHTNVFGTGNAVSLGVDNNSFSRNFNFSWQDPYFTEDGISQTVSLNYRTTKGLARFASGFNLNVVGIDDTYGIPLSEYSTLRAGVGLQDTALTTFAGSTTNILQFAIKNGTRYFTWTGHTGVSRDTRNRLIFANTGMLNTLNYDMTLPGSDLEFFRATYVHQQYVPLAFGTYFELNGRLGLLQHYGGAGEAPPYENFLAGGASTVRGFRDNSLGPSEFNIPIGGRFQAVTQDELVIPTPLESDGKSTRFSLFYDRGMVYDQPSDFSWGEMRSSGGIAFLWYTPFLGILDLSYAFPLNDKPGDRIDRFQINFRSPFF